MSDSETEPFKVSGKDSARDSLEALRKRLALALDNEAIGVKEIVQVSRRLEAVTAQLAKLDEAPRRGRPPKVVEVTDDMPAEPEKGGSTSDELARRRAARRASAS